MAKYYCILMDADNTLLDFDAAENKALAETLDEFGLEADAETVSLYRDINEKLWRRLEKGEIRRDKLLSERFGQLLTALQAKGNGHDMNRKYLQNLAQHPDMTPGVIGVLDELAEVATLAIVSNGIEQVQTQRAKDSGIADYMEEIFISEAVGCEKPNRRFFEHVLRVLGIEKREHVLVVGDSLTSDIQGGINAGLDTCWYNPNGVENNSGVKPTYEIRSLEELYPIVMEDYELANLGSKSRKHMG